VSYIVFHNSQITNNHVRNLRCLDPLWFKKSISNMRYLYLNR